MTDFDLFIPDEITLAPPHPLAQNLELQIPDVTGAAVEEIQEIQLRARIPGVVKRIIPLDAETSWQYWWCVPDRILLSEDVELIENDLPRVESILRQLVWLFGGHCFGQDTERQGDRLAVHDWQEVLEFAHQQGFDSYFLDIDYLPTAIVRSIRQSDSAEDNTNSSYVAVEPAHWHIEFFQLAATEGGFKLQEPKPLCSCQIWTAKPFIKHLHADETSTRYDLWVSRPLDLTQSPWYK